LTSPLFIGYALRKHISEALQKRSAAIRSALDRYNAAAKSLRPPRTTLKWDEVVEYAFLSDFDLLRDTRQDIRSRPWATPAGRLALDTHYKILRAREELERLNIEVQRVATHIRDEDLCLRAQENALRPTNPHLAYQVAAYRLVRGRFNSHHIRRLKQIADLSGFTGKASVGVALDALEPNRAVGGVVGVVEAEERSHRIVSSRDLQEEEEELLNEQEEVEEQEQLNNDLVDILTVSMDRVHMGLTH
jgi:hypothetical protein